MSTNLRLTYAPVCLARFSKGFPIPLDYSARPGQNPPMTKQTLTTYYTHVQQTGLLLTESHAKRWSHGVLQTLGTTLDRRTKKALTKALPDELATSLNGVFWLFHFRDNTMPSHEFQRRVGLRCGNSDTTFARHPVLAVFGGVKQIIDTTLQNQIAHTLSPEVSDLWQQA